MEIFIYAQFAPYLSGERPYYQFLTRGLDGIIRPNVCVEDIAADFIGALRSVQPTGPYLIGGECIGGVIAFEMARQLQKEGQMTDLLLLMDSWCPRQRSYFFETKPFRDVKDQYTRLKIRIMKFLGKVPLKYGVKQAQHMYKKSVLKYKPSQYSGKVTLIVSEELFNRDPTMGWRGFVQGDLDIQKVPGDHHRYIRDYPGIVGTAMNRFIENADHPLRASDHEGRDH